jgi:hypothetical protein
MSHDTVLQTCRSWQFIRFRDKALYFERPASVVTQFWFHKKVKCYCEVNIPANGTDALRLAKHICCTPDITFLSLSAFYTTQYCWISHAVILFNLFPLVRVIFSLSSAGVESRVTNRFRAGLRQGKCFGLEIQLVNSAKYINSSHGCYSNTGPIWYALI